jgi:hypothetical protein
MLIQFKFTEIHFHLRNNATFYLFSNKDSLTDYIPFYVFIRDEILHICYGTSGAENFVGGIQTVLNWCQKSLLFISSKI